MNILVVVPFAFHRESGSSLSTYYRVLALAQVVDSVTVITTPHGKDINENKIYSTNIVAMDQNGMIDVITIEASVGKNLPSRIIAFFLKFGESRTIEGIKFPVFVIYLISATILSVIMNFVFIRQKPHVPLGILSGLMLSLIVIAFL